MLFKLLGYGLIALVFGFCGVLLSIFADVPPEIGGFAGVAVGFALIPFSGVSDIRSSGSTNR
jgi:xanthine/uracil permease